MSDETGDPERPFMGARGPRKSKPQAKGGKKTVREVTQLFGEEAGAAAEERRPKGDFPAPRNEDPTPRVQKRRTKIRMGEKWTKVLDQMEADGTTMEDFVKTLTPEELARGQLKNDDGSFRGAPTKWVPSEFHRACVRELMTRGKVLYQSNYIEAIQAMTTIATTPSVDVGSRIRAAQFVIERIEGKVPERLEVGVSEPWQELLTGIVATVPEGSPMRTFDEAGQE